MKITSLAHVAEATLAELADGVVAEVQLSPPERRHLDTCDRCQALREGHRRAGQLLAAKWHMLALDEAAAGSGAPTRVVRTVGAGQLLGGSQTRRSLQWAPLVAALALMGVIGFAVWSGGGLPIAGPGPSTSPSPAPSATPSPVAPPSEAVPTETPIDLSFFPQHLAVDAAGRVYTSDCFTGRVLRVGELGGPVVVAGTWPGGFGGDGGPATEAQLSCPAQLAFDAAGNLLIADSGNNRVRMVDTDGVVSTVAGGGPAGWDQGTFAGDGGPATEARLRAPVGLAIDAEGNLYIADIWTHRIRMVSRDGIIDTVAGDGGVSPWFGGDGGPAIEATLKMPQAMAVDRDGNLYFTDTGNNRLRMIDPAGNITTIAGTGELASYGDGGPAGEAALAAPRAVAIDGDGNIYVSESVWDVIGWNPAVPEGVGNRVRRIDAQGIIHAFAGTGEIGFSGDGGPATEAQFNASNENFGLAVDAAGNVYIADSRNRRIRVVDLSGVITTFADGSR